MSSRDKEPPPLAVKTEKGLKPFRSWDLEALLPDPIGTQYELARVSRRKPKQHRTYWKALGVVVKATDRWATSSHLHDELKIACGYYRVAKNLRTSQELILPDSTAWDKMDQAEWQTYMDKAMEMLARAVGFDPLAFLDE
jgi:hypothetical protein